MLLLGWIAGGWSVTATAADERDTLLILGDSLSAGYGIAKGEEWVALLQRKLDTAQVPLRLINASISGDTTAGGLARLGPLLEQHQPDWLLIELGGNDGLRGMSLSAMQTNLQAMVELAQAKGVKPMLVAMKLPPNYGRRFAQQYESTFVQISEQYGIPLVPFILKDVAGNPALMQVDRIHPNAEGQPVIANNVWGFLQTLLPLAATGKGKE